MAGQTISLDNILSATWWATGKWTPALKRGAARDLLRLLVCRLYGASNGNLINARIQASQAALGASLGVSREWTCTLLGRLREAGWIDAYAPRLPDGHYLPCLFRPGPQLKRLLYVLVAKRQPPAARRVNCPSPSVPTKAEVEKNKSFLRSLIADLAAKRGIRQRP